MASGLKIAAAYSLPSFSLGFCGPQDKTSRKILLDFVAGKPGLEAKVRGIFEQFEAAYHYYQLIAKKNNIADPLDERVVRAFWVGNSLLEKVNAEDLKKLILSDFCRPGLLTKAQAEEKVKTVREGARPHHSFHVLVLGAIAGRVRLERVMLDLCRVGWGRVTKIQNSKFKIQNYKPLVIGKKIELGKEIEKEITWDEKVVPEVRTGDWVSFHWGQACEVLTPAEVKNLEHYTQKTVGLVNAQSK
jgi:hydrogenase maturation factor